MSSKDRTRILVVTRNLPPLVGGMERLNWHMAEELSKRADVRVIGPAGAAGGAPEGVIVREAPLKPLWKFLLHARALACREARRWKPDIVLAGSGLTAPLVRGAARRCSARTAAYVHGLDVAVQHPVYRAIWLPALRRMDRVIANSHATATLCRGIGIEPSRIGIVHPGVDLPGKTIPSRVSSASASLCPPRAGEGEVPTPFGTTAEENPTPFGTKAEEQTTPFGTKGVAPQARGDERPDETPDFRIRHNLANRPLLLSVGRLSARKGLREFVTQALPRIAAAHRDVMLLIVGDAPKDALHAEAQTPDSIRAAAAQADVADNLCFLGSISDQELAAAFRAADVHVFPVREIPGDPEGFGMVAVEAAAHGLPTVAFATGGVVDAVAEGRSGHLVAADDYPALAEAILKASSERYALCESCVEFARQFAWPAFGSWMARQLGLP